MTATSTPGVCRRAWNKANSHAAEDTWMGEWFIALVVAVPAALLGTWLLVYFSWAAAYWFRLSPPRYWAGAAMLVGALVVIVPPTLTWVVMRRRGKAARQRVLASSVALLAVGAVVGALLSLAAVAATGI